MSTRSRGRPRGFDLDTILDGAVEAFWERGYARTSIRDLESALDVSASSLYHAFGSKQQMLLRAIDRYEDRIRAELFAPLEASDGGPEAISTFFAQLRAWVDRTDHRGCLVVNLMATAGEEQEIVARVQAYRDGIRRRFFDAFRRAGTPEGLAAARAELLLAAVLGLHITARTARDGSELDAMVRAIQDTIAAW